MKGTAHDRTHQTRTGPYTPPPCARHRRWITDGVQSGDVLADRTVIWTPRSITLRDIDGTSVFSKNLEPQHA